MPKALDKKQPSSSVANMLDANVGAAALQTPARREEPLKPTPLALDIPPKLLQVDKTGEAANIHRQFILTNTTDETLKRLVAIYSRATGIDLKSTELMRAILIALNHAAVELEREAAHIGALKRPKNEKGNEHLRDRLERKIARAIIAGMRATTLMEENGTQGQIALEAISSS
jgi:hypothetical protein